MKLFSNDIASLLFPILDHNFLISDGSNSNRVLISSHDSFICRNNTNVNLNQIPLIRDTFWRDTTFTPMDSITKICNIFLEKKESKILLKEKSSSIKDIDKNWFDIAHKIDNKILCAWKWRNSKNYEHCPLKISYNQPFAHELFKAPIGDYHVHSGAVGLLEDFLLIIPPNEGLVDILKPKNLKRENYIEDNSLIPTSNKINPYCLRVAHGVLSWLISFLNSISKNNKKNLIPFANLDATIKYTNKLFLLLFFQGEFLSIDKDDLVCETDMLLKNIILPSASYAGQIKPADIKFLCESMTFYSDLSVTPKDHFSKIYIMLFNKLIWLRCYIFRFFTQSSDREGLIHFKKWYDRIKYSTEKTYSLQEKIKIVSDNQYNQQLKNIEFRKNIKNIKKKLPTIIKDYANWQGWQKQTKQSELIDNGTNRFAISLSFIKEDLDRDNDQISNGKSLYSSSLNTYLRSLNEFIDIIKQTPSILYLIRGLDVCNIETAMPNWMFVLLFKHFNKTINKHDFCLFGKIPEVRHTFHAGEDYYTLQTGLRYIDEAALSGALRKGDRIGHGLALGISPTDWLKSKENLGKKIPIGEYFDDLIWEWGLVKNNKKHFSTSLSEIEDEIDCIRSEIEDRLEIFDNNFKLSTMSYRNLWSAYKYRFDYQKLINNYGSKVSRKNLKLLRGNEWFSKNAKDDFYEFNLSNPKDDLILYYHYLYDPIFWDILAQPLMPKNEHSTKKRWEELQSYLLKQLKYKAIAIEACPTSNAMISGIPGKYSDHPIFQWLPINEKKQINTLINSDDPILFNTNIYKEYESIFYAAENNYKEKGVDDLEIVDWLKQIAENGHKYSFTLKEAKQAVFVKCKEEGML